MASQYFIANGPMPTTAAQATVTTGAAIKTMLQLKPFNPCKVIAWGISLDGAAASTIKCELLETGTVFATVTASADADVTKMSGSADLTVASVMGLTLGTSATGYTGTAEGSITTVRMFDPQILVTGTTFGAAYSTQFPLGREPQLIVGNAARIRVTATVAVNAYCWMQIEF
jgi:hypothetical protein